MSKLLQVNDLTTEFTGDFGKKISVDHVSFDVAEGETVCIVGESGCGKSVTSLSIMGLLGRGGAVVDGSVLFANKNLLDMDEKQLDTIRGNQMTMIFRILNIVKPGVYDRKPDHGEHPDSYASVKKRSRRACGHDLRESRYAGCACCNEKISAYAFRRNASASDDRDGTLL